MRRWHEWTENCRYTGGWRKDVVRSLITLKALSFAPTGAIAAAATTSLPEQIGGVRNWDYRYSWLRDAVVHPARHCCSAGYDDEALAWATWLRRAVAGHPGEFQIMYGVNGERRLTEMELPWLAGYEGSAPVRIGNAATAAVPARRLRRGHGHRLHRGESRVPRAGKRPNAVILALLEHLETVWEEPDDGIWEVRGPRRHFTHSKLMAWVAFDRGVRLADMGGVRRTEPSRTRGERLRDEVHAQICAKGWNDEVGRVHTVLRVRRARRLAAHDGPGGLSPSGRPADRRDRRGDPATSSWSTGSCCGTERCEIRTATVRPSSTAFHRARERS